jgi:hypothetical protein
MCLIQIKQAQIKFPLSGFWTVYFLICGVDIVDEFVNRVNRRR